ncbi:heterokaryon incompatibility protein-domain-containing protein, partial [Phaeosphaeriaceae sp. PMI808]
MAQLIRRAKEGARYVRELDRTQDGRPIFKSQNYDPLNTRGAIRILKIFYGPPEEVGIHCEFIAGTVLDYDERQSRVLPIKFEPYDALSWCWGTQAEDSWISIRKNGTQYAKSVRPELVSALRALRHPVYDRTLWVDAVCINQSNDEERNHQVEMMAEIYSKADCVRIWLGNPTESSTLAIRFIKNEVLQLQHFDELCESVEASVKWRSLLELMQRPWFSRRWVVQEVALAKRTIIHCGSAKLSWTKFAVAVELFVEVETATHRLSEVMKKDPSYWHVPMWFEYVSSLGASLLVDATGRLFRSEAPQRISNSGSPRPEARVCEISLFLEDGDEVHYESEDDEPLSSEDRLWQRELDEQAHHIAPKAQPLLDLEYLVSSLAVTNTSKPHDTIYALLAIAKDTIPTAAAKEPQVRDYIQASLMKLTQRQRKQYIIDYHAPYAEVCQYFIQWSIDRTSQTDPSRALDILCRPWAFDSQKAGGGSSEPALPSWIPQLSKAAYVMDTQPGMHGMKIGRKNADPLVGAPSITQRNYAAAETKGLDRKTFRFRKRRTCADDVELDSFSMYVKGFVLDTITTISSSSQNGAVPSEWAELVGWDHTTSNPPEHFWRTLVADRGKDGRNPPVYYSRACKESFRKGSFQSGTVDTSGLINNERNSVVAQFCRRVQAVIWNRCLVKTSSSKLGLVPKGTQPGDVICILYGCSVPVVLRQR